MPRQIVDLDGLTKKFPLSKWQIYRKIRDPENPLPHKKAGKRLLFDMDRVYDWFDELPVSKKEHKHAEIIDN